MFSGEDIRMYRILVKPLPGVEDIDVYGETLTEFQRYIEELIQFVTEANSPYLVTNYTLVKMEECIASVATTPLGFCPVIFDSVTCFPATAPGTIQKSPCPRDNYFYIIGFSFLSSYSLS